MAPSEWIKDVKPGRAFSTTSSIKRQAPSRAALKRVGIELVVCTLFLLGGFKFQLLRCGVSLEEDMREAMTHQAPLVEDSDLAALHATAKNWLRPWERTGRAAGGISEEQVSEVFAFLQSKKVGSLRIHVRDGALQEPTVVKEWLKQKMFYPPRIKHWMNLFRHIQATQGLPDYLDLIVSTEDQAFLPTSFAHINGAPIFVYASTLGHYDIPIPTMEYFGNKLKDVDLGIVTAQQWGDRIGAPAIWRGSPTGGLYTKQNYQTMQRYQLVNASKHYPDLVDARFMACAPGQCTDEAWAAIETELPTGGTQFKYPDYIKHKYLIDIDGNAWSSRFILLLSTGCVIFKVETPWVEYFNEFLVPYKHYIPVASDSSDLPEKIQYAIDHDDEMRAMSENLLLMFNRFVANGRWEQYVKALLTEYSQLLIRPGANSTEADGSGEGGQERTVGLNQSVGAKRLGSSQKSVS